MNFIVLGYDAGVMSGAIMFLVGIGAGFALTIAPVYTAEVSPASSRGALTSISEIFINVGILLGYISNYFLSALPAHISWRLMLDVPNSQILQKKHHGEGVWRELLWPTPPLRRMLIIALGIQFFQQASGIDAIVYYSPVVFKKSGIQSQAGLLRATVAVGFFENWIYLGSYILDR
ncbi:hypothetical protein SUGI_0586770 [Cryptomeria japonica]|nr:hypothetical protein SUGI_0586770 [Cryptomeria japonica]